MINTNKISWCEVCGNKNLRSVLNLGRQPLCDDLVQFNDKRVCEDFPIEILYCDNCSTAHQRFQVPKIQLFPRTYHYRSRFTADVINGLSDLVDACENRLKSLQGKLVLDVGCNDSSLLDFFQKKGANTIGIEPTEAYRDGLGKGHILINDFFSPQTASDIYKKYGSPDIITFTNVFAHIENLPDVIDALKILMSSSSMLVVENHYIGAVLNLYQFDTFYHEHPRTYSLNSFKFIAKSIGVTLNGVEFPSRYGGNIRVFMGPSNMITNASAALIERVLNTEACYGDRLCSMQSIIKKWITTMTMRLCNLVERYGKLAGKAFPGRAAILVNILKLDVDVIDAVYEKPGSMKIGHYLPGTRIPIKSDEELFGQQDKYPVLINFAWHISGEINNYLQTNGYVGKIIDIFSPQEFSELN